MLKDVVERLKNLRISIGNEPEFKYLLMDRLTEEQMKEVNRIDTFLTELQTPLEHIEIELKAILKTLQDII